MGRDPTDEEISEEMCVPRFKITQLKTISLSPFSLDAPVGDNGQATFEEVIADESSSDPAEILRDKTIYKHVRETIQELDERERKILTARFGLDNSRPNTLDMIGKKFNVTREQIRQIQNIALRKLRSKLHNQEMMAKEILN